MIASPDDRVHDSSTAQALGIAEYKNPYSARDLTLEGACGKIRQFCLERKEEDGKVTYRVKRDMITTTKYSVKCIAVMYNGVTLSHEQTRTYM